MKNLRNITKVIFVAAMAAMCIQSSVFAADNITSVKNTTTFVNEGGCIGQAVIGTSNTTAITNEGSNNYTEVANTDVMLNEDGVIDVMVKLGENTTVITNKGKNNITSVENLKEIYN